MSYHKKALCSRLHALDSSALSDALDSFEVEGALWGMSPVNEGKKIAGPAFTVEYEKITDRQKGTFHGAGNYIDAVGEGDVIVIAGGSHEWTNWGDILSATALQKKISGTVLDGSARDVSDIREMGYPLFCKNIFMRSGKNRSRIASIGQPVTVSGLTISPGDWIFGDDNGVVRLPQKILEDVITRAECINETEERIRLAIKNGMDVTEARKTYRYDQPWLSAGEK